MLPAQSRALDSPDDHAVHQLLDALRRRDGADYLQVRDEAVRKFDALSAYTASLRKQGALTGEDELLLAIVRAWHEADDMLNQFYTSSEALYPFFVPPPRDFIPLESHAGARLVAMARKNHREEFLVALATERVLKSFSCPSWVRALHCE